MSGKDEDFERSQGSSVSHSLVKMQEIKCYQPQTGTSHLKLNKTNLWCQTDKDEKRRRKVPGCSVAS